MPVNIENVLATTPLLSGLDTTERAGLASSCRVIPLKRKETLFLEGDPVEACYVVVSGSIKVYKLSPNGREQVLHVVEPGQSFAEGALFGMRGYPASAEAARAAEVISVPRDSLITLLEQNPATCKRLFGSMALWLRRLTDIIASLSFRDVETRVVSYLLGQCRSKHGTVENGAMFDLGIEKATLAAHLGTTPETLSRALRKMQDSGLILVDGPRITIVQAAEMEQVLEEGV